MYPISEQLIKLNRSYESLSPEGFVIHSTDTPGATDENEQNYFNNNNVKSSAHYFVDNDSIIRTIPEKEVAWGCGNTGNHRFLQVEMCEVEPFIEVWNRTVWLVADACVRYGWTTGPNVYSHRGISEMYGETNHTDPIQFLANHGKTWDQLLEAIDGEIANIKKGGNNMPEDKDGYIILRVLDSKADAVVQQIIQMGYAAKRIILP